MGLSRRDHVRSTLKELNSFKLALMTYTIDTRHCPDYLSDRVQMSSSDPAWIHLCSAQLPTPTTVLRMRGTVANDMM